MKLKQFRQDNGLSQNELGKKVGYTQQAVAKWESGESEPNSKTLIKLSQIFNCSVDELLKEG